LFSSVSLKVITHTPSIAGRTTATLPTSQSHHSLNRIEPQYQSIQHVAMQYLTARHSDYTQPVGFGSPATLQAPLAGPLGNRS
jgi:hypothetical protein